MSQDQAWALGGEILDKGLDHPSLAEVARAYSALLTEIRITQERGENLKRFGAGRTEHPTIIRANIIPALRELAETAFAIASQMDERLKGG